MKENKEKREIESPNFYKNFSVKSDIYDFNIKNLKTNKTYFFCVSAHNQNGFSAKSEMISHTTSPLLQKSHSFVSKEDLVQLKIQLNLAQNQIQSLTQENSSLKRKLENFQSLSSDGKRVTLPLDQDENVQNNSFNFSKKKSN